MIKHKLIGPFAQLLPMTGIPLKGGIPDSRLPVLTQAGLLLRDGRVLAIGSFRDLQAQHTGPNLEIYSLPDNCVGLPGFIDAHTHICFGGSRARDYAMRNAGKTYLEIAKAGGGIWDTVMQTRNAGGDELVKGILQRAKRHLRHGVTTLEVKSGYGLSVKEELKMLYAIRDANKELKADLIPTCLAAHMLPRDFNGKAADYLLMISEELLPKLKSEGLANRVDAFIEDGAFTRETITPYFTRAKEMGFDITVHADQFSTGGSAVAVQFNAISADHLEASTETEIQMLANSNVIATALPGASIGLGCAYTPARKLLDAGACLAIASDHNPGSAPMGELLTQASILGAFEKLTNAEVLAGITFRAAAALGLSDRGRLGEGMLADLAIFRTDNYQEILYNQGTLNPCQMWKGGELVFTDTTEQ